MVAGKNGQVTRFRLRILPFFTSKLTMMACIRSLFRPFFLLALCLPAVALCAQQDEPASRPAASQLVLRPDPPGQSHNHRLILKDGGYQKVRQYKVEGDRVRYISVERGGAWEELPVDLVDWPATSQWEQNHGAPRDEDLSPAMQQARAIDKEEVDERLDQLARMPEVAPGLQLPDQDSVFALDSFDGKPELVEMLPTDVQTQTRTRKGIETLNPLAGGKTALELEGAHAAVHLHAVEPAIYLALNVAGDKEPLLARAVEVNTSRERAAANRKRGAHAAQSGFAIVRLDERRAVRMLGAIHVSPTGKISQDEDVIPAHAEVLDGRYWLKIVPTQKLASGEYALVEILSPTELSQSVWDFRIDPASGPNAGSITPIRK